MKIITSGAPFIDIDAYACIVAYQELLQQLGEEAVGVSTSLLNESITPSLRALPTQLQTAYQLQADDQYVVADVSNPDDFDPIVQPERVVAIFDHHTGFETEWREKLGDNCHIEFIGTAGTLIYEQWAKAGRQDQMSAASAQLLAAAILDNTLNFNADVTTQRDRDAYSFLATHAQLPSTWAASYFKECEQSIVADLAAAIRNDKKYFRREGLDKELAMGQLALWDARGILAHDLATFGSVLRTPDKLWLVNLMSIAEGKSYFISDCPEVHAWLQKLTGAIFHEQVAGMDRLWLRKEIIKAAQKR